MNLPAAETAGYLGNLFMSTQTLNSLNCSVLCSFLISCASCCVWSCAYYCRNAYDATNYKFELQRSHRCNTGVYYDCTNEFYIQPWNWINFRISCLCDSKKFFREAQRD